jgi:dATP pyrophosphohydrolase
MTVVMPHYVLVCAVTRNCGSPQVLLLHRSCGRWAGQWQMVTGKLRTGEHAADAALRELGEETGLTPQRLYAGDIVESYYDIEKNAIIHGPVFVAFVSSAHGVTLSKEHDEYQWLSFDEAASRVGFSELRRVIQHIAESYIRRDPPTTLLVGPRNRTDGSRA